MNHRTDTIDASLLDRHLAGECTPEEEAAVRAWLAADPERGRLVAAMRGEHSPAGETDAAWERLSARLSLAEPVPAAWRRGTRLLRVAAAVLVLLGGALVWRQWSGAESDVARAGYLAERATGVGESVALRLSDGTRVTLAPASRLRVRGGYGEGAREIELEGEALFDVSRDPSRPFRVRTGEATTEVLGTRFGVRSGAGGVVRVVVASGRVSLRTADDPGVVLERADLGEVGAEGRVTATRGIDLDRYLAWSTGRLVFEDAPLAQALAELERWHRVELAVSDPALARRALTASYVVTQPLPEVLASIALAMNARVERRGSALHLAPNP
jgi:transmembrane sensor